MNRRIKRSSGWGNFMMRLTFACLGAYFLFLAGKTFFAPCPYSAFIPAIVGSVAIMAAFPLAKKFCSFVISFFWWESIFGRCKSPEDWLGSFRK